MLIPLSDRHLYLMTEVVHAAEERAVRSRRRPTSTAFESPAVHRKFELAMSRAQEAFLAGRLPDAEREAGLALAICPTAEIFAFMAVIAEARGQFERASDFRLLQAFLAKDQALWEQLLHDFLSTQRFYKAVVCLQRLSSLEQVDKHRYRQLQLQLADLLIGLGEVRRAVSVLLPLWTSSNCQDFETFSILSGLYFQLGKRKSLEGILTASLHTFGITNDEGNGRPWRVADPSEGRGRAGEPRSSTAEDDGDEEDRRRRASRKQRVSKRIRFFGIDGVDNNNDDGVEETGSHREPGGEVEADDSADFGGGEAKKGQEAKRGDEGYDGSGTALASTTSSVLLPSVESPSRQKDFLTLINVYTELLNECGRFHETIQLTVFSAGVLKKQSLLEMPVDLLLRIGTAYAFCSSEDPQLVLPCQQIFQHLLQVCRMEEFADVLMDAAGMLRRAGVYDVARELLVVLIAYYRREVAQTERQLAERHEKHQNLLLSCFDETEEREGVAHVQEELAALTEALHDAKVVVAEGIFGLAQCARGQDLDDVAAEQYAREAVAVDPTHLPARLLLGKLRYYAHGDLPGAVQILTPLPEEPGMQRVQLGACLVSVFRHSTQYIEAIALGISIFNMILLTPDDGDEESVAPGSSAASSRRSLRLQLPALSRASSSLVPAASLTAMLQGGSGQASRAGGGTLLSSLASSVRSGSSVFQQQLHRMGTAALTTTVSGASAAQSIASGWDRDAERERAKDASAVFRFHRKRNREGSNGDSAAAAAAAKRLRLAHEAQEDEEQQDDDEERDDDDDGRRRRRGAQRRRKAAKSKEGGEEQDDAEGVDQPRPLGNASMTAEVRDRDLLELEEALDKEADDEDEHEEEGEELSSYQIPTLEEVAASFGDVAMADLFMEATTERWDTRSSNSNTMGAGLSGGDRTLPQLFSNAAASSGSTATAALPEVVAEVKRTTVSARDVIQTLGRHECMDLASDVMCCYHALGRFSEAKEFASVVLARFSFKRQSPHHQYSLERPLQMALLHSSIAAGEAEDGYRVGLRMLQDSVGDEEREEVLQLLFSMQQKCEDRAALLQRHVAEGHDDPPLLVLLASRYLQTRSYRMALNLHLAAHTQRPSNIYLYFVTGVTYLLCSHQKMVKEQEACVSAGLYFLGEYQRRMLLISPMKRRGEVLFNIARAMQYLRQPSRAIPLYERIINDLRVPDACSREVRRAAQFNLSFIYRWTSLNPELATTTLLS